MYAPIVLFVYNRPEHTKRTVAALAENCLASKSDLWIFSDGPKSDTAMVQVSKVRNYIAKIQEQSLFQSVRVVESQDNKGLADSIIQGVTTVIEKSGCVIVLEDDIVTAPDFLKFMNDCLSFYSDEPVGAISGYSPIEELPRDYNGSVYVTKRNCSHGWATWKHRWDGVDWKAKDFDRLQKNRCLRREFDSTGADRFDRLRRQVQEDIDSWSILFGFHLFNRGLLVVYPSVNRVSNIGFDGSGIHTGKAEVGAFYSEINSHPVPYTLSLPQLDDRILGLFYNIYSGSRIRVLIRRLRNSRGAFVWRSVNRFLRRDRR